MKPIKKPSSAKNNNGICRRGFLAAGLAMTACCLFPYKSLAAISVPVPAVKKLSFYNTHTGEDLSTVYCEKGAYLPQSLSSINHILRDFRTEEVIEISTDLLDLLFALRQKLESTSPFHVISGYRSPKTNSLLNIMDRGVAANSLHQYGKAIDIRLPGYDLKTLQRAAIELRKGGVGSYPSSDFVHVDVGRIRLW
jgi:uncharacterized protein YcbK (DUF882 family)